MGIFRHLYGDYQEFFRPLFADALDVLGDCLQSTGMTEEGELVKEEARRIPS